MKTSKKIRIIISATLFLLLFGLLIFESARALSASLNTSNEILASTVTKIPFLRPIYNSVTNPSLAFRKVFGHFTPFLILGGLGCWFCKEAISSKIKEVTLILFIGVLSSTIIELVQLFPEGRGADFNDVLLNLYGFFTASLIFDLTAVLISKKQKALKHDDLKISLINVFISLIILILSIIFPPKISGAAFCYVFYLVVIIVYTITTLTLYFTIKKSRF